MIYYSDGTGVSVIPTSVLIKYHPDTMKLIMMCTSGFNKQVQISHMIISSAVTGGNGYLGLYSGFTSKNRTPVDSKLNFLRIVSRTDRYIALLGFPSNFLTESAR